MVGRKPKPTALRLLEGNREHRPIPDDNPEPSQNGKFPHAPKNLDEAARKEWEGLGLQLWEASVLTSWDLSMFARYCYLYSKTEPDKKPSNADLQQYRMYAALFGIDPSDRCKLHVSKRKPQEDDSPFAGL